METETFLDYESLTPVERLALHLSMDVEDVKEGLTILYVDGVDKLREDDWEEDVVLALWLYSGHSRHDFPKKQEKKVEEDFWDRINNLADMRYSDGR
ncbi:hypothetical protein UFOVP967_52 [uncultured Caudovirales phage]|uniref:Uncharacterized protein n=1 Tax=uncultured Caudovirales phage TaxID=2100421 RepID=A0A6J5QYJ7_9CAUD|nr:hypothetical protein UFOVP521_64 [uncultured Caudovirales phage]CAB4167565.1 hypothetical protein UFOVP856_36 [uncultured Caudovirales phage]CAB4174466.1 hypothetical protein UFOVP967_52 [uncultured Caudovirales phage]CAB4180442.1 hypothetical protein UFOVP1036_29 [uncultured Caudovirales phage]CAB4186230.1 hypothetical protein UFOVP1132_38 [uncultured Caudovirales phage]